MNLAQHICHNTFIFFINNWSILVIGILFYRIWQKHFTINQNTNNVDLMARYVYLLRQRKNR